MRLLVNNMKRRAALLERVIEEKTECLKDRPQGHIWISESHSSQQIYFREDKSHTRGKYLRLGDEKRTQVQDLIQRDYDERVLDRARDELKTLKILIRKYEKGTCEDIYGRMSEIRRSYITPIMPTDEEYIESWQNDPYTPLGFEDGAPVYLAGTGLRVRSKNEIMFEDKFEEYGIPRKFECPLYLKGFGTVYPDFTLLNIRQRKEYFLEILGMMDDPEYAVKNIKKIQAYQRNGYIMGKNLIIAFDIPDCPESPRDIDEMVKIFLL